MPLAIDSKKLAVSVLESIMALDDLPLDVTNRVATALVLLDCQEGEDFDSAIKDAYSYINKSLESLEQLINDSEQLLN